MKRLFIIIAGIVGAGYLVTWLMGRSYRLGVQDAVQSYETARKEFRDKATAAMADHYEAAHQETDWYDADAPGNQYRTFDHQGEGPPTVTAEGITKDAREATFFSFNRFPAQPTPKDRWDHFFPARGDQ